MQDRSMSNTLTVILIALIVVGAGLYYYDHVIEPRSDGPMERAGEKLDNAMKK